MALSTKAVFSYYPSDEDVTRFVAKSRGVSYTSLEDVDIPYEEK